MGRFCAGLGGILHEGGNTTGEISSGYVWIPTMRYEWNIHGNRVGHE